MLPRQTRRIGEGARGIEHPAWLGRWVDKHWVTPDCPAPHHPHTLSLRTGQLPALTRNDIRTRSQLLVSSHPLQVPLGVCRGDWATPPQWLMATPVFISVPPLSPSASFSLPPLGSPPPISKAQAHNPYRSNTHSARDPGVGSALQRATPPAWHEWPADPPASTAGAPVRLPPCRQLLPHAVLQPLEGEGGPRTRRRHQRQHHLVREGHLRPRVEIDSCGKWGAGKWGGGRVGAASERQRRQACTAGPRSLKPAQQPLLGIASSPFLPRARPPIIQGVTPASPVSCGRVPSTGSATATSLSLTG